MAILSYSLNLVDALDFVCRVISICLIVSVASNLSYSLCLVCLIICVANLSYKSGWVH